jgi:geranylgeranyl diphosphate synthase type I
MSSQESLTVGVLGPTVAAAELEFELGITSRSLVGVTENRGAGVTATIEASTRRELPQASTFVTYAARLRPKIEEALEGWLARRSGDVEGLPEAVRAPVEAAFDLARRGGKRWRAILLACTYEGFGGAGGGPAVVLAGVALELLQTYLLIHDDWMDHDEMRRGGPSVPAMMRARFELDLADASAILAGDYAASIALEALLAVPCTGDRIARAAREFARAGREVVVGQLLDMHGAPASTIERTHSLKTASYTVRAPIAIGARLAGADDATCADLEAFSDPLGVAFQLRDDVLGTFGDPSSTGKPARSDLREGKRTALIAEIAHDPRGAALFGDLSRPDVRDEEIDAFAAYLVSSGARERVEARIETLLDRATRALDAPSIPEAVRRPLLGAVLTLGHRER